MAQLQWDAEGARLFETGIEHGVLFVAKGTEAGYNNGIAWNGLISVSEKPEGGESTKLYANNRKYLDLLSAEEFTATIGAYTYPDEYMACDGSKEAETGIYISQQERVKFGLSYETIVGSDLNQDHSRKLHIIWNAQAKPSEREFKSINDNPEAIEFSWDVSTTPVDVKVDGFKPASHMVIDRVKVGAEKYKKITDKLWGTSNTEPTLPTPAEIIALIKED